MAAEEPKKGKEKSALLDDAISKIEKQKSEAKRS